jgi:PIN domain nuclease of toxin-antitoxin system
MTILLDTCEFLWFVSGNPKLPARLKQEIQNPKNSVFLSVVSLWEIIVKEKIGKLPLPKSAAQYVPEQRRRHGILNLDLGEPAVMRLSLLPSIHRDPFDRMLVCQAQEHNLHLASSDLVMGRYPVTLV